jgi:peptidoglycan/LPS O-acetylase OafA/YrhL
VAGVVTIHKGELLSALYAANYFHARSWFTEHYWSLSMEEHFYLFWPAILAFARPRKARLLALAIVGALLFYRPWGEAHFDADAYQHTDMRLDAFLLPCILAILLKDSEWRARLVSLLRPWVCVVLFAAVCVLSAIAAAKPLYGNVQKLFQSAVCPLLIVSTVLRPSSLGVLLELSAIRWIGRISYSLYIWQQLFLFHARPGPPFILRLPLIVAMAVASYYLIERPMIRFGHRMARTPALPASLDSIPVRSLN